MHWMGTSSSVLNASRLDLKHAGALVSTQYQTTAPRHCRCIINALLIPNHAANRIALSIFAEQPKKQIDHTTSTGPTDRRPVSMALSNRLKLLVVFTLDACSSTTDGTSPRPTTGVAVTGRIGVWDSGKKIEKMLTTCVHYRI